jgi:hypothetical protein
LVRLICYQTLTQMNGILFIIFIYSSKREHSSFIE